MKHLLRSSPLPLLIPLKSSRSTLKEFWRLTRQLIKKMTTAGQFLTASLLVCNLLYLSLQKMVLCFIKPWMKPFCWRKDRYGSTAGNQAIPETNTEKLFSSAVNYKCSQVRRQFREIFHCNRELLHMNSPSHGGLISLKSLTLLSTLSLVKWTSSHSSNQGCQVLLI